MARWPNGFGPFRRSWSRATSREAARPLERASLRDARRIGLERQEPNGLVDYGSLVALRTIRRALSVARMPLNGPYVETGLDPRRSELFKCPTMSLPTHRLSGLNGSSKH
jgi:hypothetical protein